MRFVEDSGVGCDDLYTMMEEDPKRPRLCNEKHFKTGRNAPHGFNQLWSYPTVQDLSEVYWHVLIMDEERTHEKVVLRCVKEYPHIWNWLFKPQRFPAKVPYW